MKRKILIFTMATLIFWLSTESYAEKYFALDAIIVGFEDQTRCLTLDPRLFSEIEEVEITLPSGKTFNSKRILENKVFEIPEKYTKAYVAKEAEIVTYVGTDSEGDIIKPAISITFEEICVGDLVSFQFSEEQVGERGIEGVQRIHVASPSMLFDPNVQSLPLGELITHDFFILKVDAFPQTGYHFGGPFMAVQYNVVPGEVVQIVTSIRIVESQFRRETRGLGFRDFTVQFIDTTSETVIGEVKGEDVTSNGLNGIATFKWFISGDTLRGEHEIKIIVVPHEEISRDPDMNNNEAAISINVIEEVGESFYCGVPPAGDKKIGVVIFQEVSNHLLLDLLLSPEGFLRPINDINRSGPTIFYIEEFLSKACIEHTGKNLISIDLEIIGPYIHKIPLDSIHPAKYMEDYVIKEGINLEQYDIVAFIYLVDKQRNISQARRSIRQVYIEGHSNPGGDEHSFRDIAFTFFHEIMHVFGAWDHFYGFASLCNPPDIMSSSGNLTINQWTAQEIGWADRNHNGIIDAEEPELYQFHGPSDKLAWVVTADRDKNGAVDISDLLLVVRAFGEKITYPHNNPNPDVNGDGIVDIKDIILVAKHIGESYEAAAPPKDGWQVSPEDMAKLREIRQMLEALPQDEDIRKAVEFINRVITLAKSNPPHTALLQNYPNPFNPETWIPYQLAEEAEVRIKIFGATGQLIRTLDIGRQPAGLYLSKQKAACWDGRNSSGELVGSGLYFYTIECQTATRGNDFTATKKMVIER